MSSLRKKIFGKVVSNDFSWTFIKGPVAASAHIKHYREQVIRQREIQPIIDKATTLFSDLVVKNGPFKGLKYPEFLATGSAIFPKLVGSYERELHPLVEELIKNNYSQLIDVGCAEGFYAVGLALKSPKTEVFAYDTDPVSRKACLAMAKLNKVDERVAIGSTCTAETLKNFPFKGKTLIISDCEGYEKQLLTRENIQQLKECDLLIEIHDFVDKHTSTYIKELFTKTHSLKVIDSLSDHLKVMRYEYPELSDLDYKHKFTILAEGRPGTMEWFYLTPKN